jgi:hypothetical protein
LLQIILMPSKPRNRLGEIYGRLTVVRISDRRSAAGNAYWWCRCTCGNEREVPSDSLSNKIRRKKNITECLECARELTTEGVCQKNDREEVQRRKLALATRENLIGHVPKAWLNLPLTDSHARELGKKTFFRGIRCLNGHISPYRINGGCLVCSRSD